MTPSSNKPHITEFDIIFYVDQDSDAKRYSIEQWPIQYGRQMQFGVIFGIASEIECWLP